MSENKNEMMQQEENNHSMEPEVVDVDKETNGMETGDTEDNDDGSAFLADDFECGELLLDAGEDRGAFKLFLRVATDNKEGKKGRKEAIDKLLYIALKNHHNPELLDNDTWEEIEKLSMKRKKGYEYADLLLHFRYYVKGVGNGNEKKALEYLDKYFEKLEDNESEISPIAYLQKGICFTWGVGMKAEEISDKKAMIFYRKAEKKGCVAAYRYIVSSYLYGGPEIRKNLRRAKKEFDKGIKCLTERFENGEREVVPFFAGLVQRCFLGEWENLKNDMERAGKKWTEYMIANGIEGGNSLKGNFFLVNSDEFNTTLARKSYEEALKHNEASAYWGMAVLNLVEKNYEEAYKWACRGTESAIDHTCSLLGQMYEDQGDENEGNTEKAKKCYCEAWKYYEKGYCLFGMTSEYLGKLYFDKKVIPKGFDLDTLEDYLEHSAMMPTAEAIKYYLRFVQKKHKLDCDKIDFRCIYKLPLQYRRKYRKFLQIGANILDVDLLSEYARLLMGEWKRIKDKKEKEKGMAYIVSAAGKVLFGAGEFREFVGVHADEGTKAKFPKSLLKERTVLFIDDVEFIYKHADEVTRAKLFKKLLVSPFLGMDDVEFIYKHADEVTRAKLFKKLVEDAHGFFYGEEKIEFVYRLADERSKAILSKKLVKDSYIVRNKEQFYSIIKHYKGRQDGYFTDWVAKSLTILFFSENEDKARELSAEVKDAIEKSTDEELKKQIESLSTRFQEGGEILSSVDWVASLVSIIENTNDEGMIRLVEKYKTELEGFIDSCDAELSCNASGRE